MVSCLILTKTDKGHKSVHSVRARGREDESDGKTSADQETEEQCDQVQTALQQISVYTCD